MAKNKSQYEDEITGKQSFFASLKNISSDNNGCYTNNIPIQNVETWKMAKIKNAPKIPKLKKPK